MALNLNKDSNDDKSSTPPNDEKKVFNLNKSEDKANTKLNLSKE